MTRTLFFTLAAMLASVALAQEVEREPIPGSNRICIDKDGNSVNCSYPNNSTTSNFPHCDDGWLLVTLNNQLMCAREFRAPTTK